MVQEWGKECAADREGWTTHLRIGNAASEGQDLHGQKQAKAMRTAFSFCFSRQGMGLDLPQKSIEKCFLYRDEVLQDMSVIFEQQSTASPVLKT